MVTESGHDTSLLTARHYECRSPLASQNTPLAPSGTERHATAHNGTQCSATHSAKNPHCMCGESRPEQFARKARKNGRIGYQHLCKRCMVESHRKWRATASGRAKMRAGVTASKRRYPERQRARSLLRYAITTGKLTPGPCYAAGPECAGQIEGHHEDYEKPLEVTWTCRKHHSALDRNRRAATFPVRRPQTGDVAYFFALLELGGLYPVPPKGSTRRWTTPPARPAGGKV